MTDAYRTAYVYVRNTFTGKLCETDEGYSLPMIRIILHSLTLPLRHSHFRFRQKLTRLTLFSRSLMDLSQRAGCLTWSVATGSLTETTGSDCF